MDYLVERNNLYYKKFTNVPFTGEISGEKNGSFKKGKKDGEWLFIFLRENYWNKKSTCILINALVYSIKNTHQTINVELMISKR